MTCDTKARYDWGKTVSIFNFRSIPYNARLYFRAAKLYVTGYEVSTGCDVTE